MSAMPFTVPGYGYGNRNGLTPEEEDSLVRAIGRTGMSGLSMVGNLLDVPGATVRNALSWLPGGQGANVLAPLFSPFSGEGRVSGRDLLTDVFGMRPNQETGIGGWWSDPLEGVYDVAGFGADVALDPLTYLTLGTSAAGKGAKALKAAGLGDEAFRMASQRLGGVGPRQAGLTMSVGDILSQAAPDAARNAYEFAKRQGYDLAAHLQEPARPLATWSLPFMDPLLLGGTGRGAKKVAQFFDRYSPNIFGGEFGTHIPLIGSQQPLGIAAKQLFHAPSLGRGTAEAQAHAAEFFQRNQAASAKTGTWMADALLRAQQAGLDPEELRMAAEGVLRSSGDPAKDAALNALGREIRDQLAQAPELEKAAGWKSPRWTNPFAEYTPRHGTQQAEALETASRGFGPMGASAKTIHREDLFNGFTGGTAQINDVATQMRSFMDTGKTDAEVADFARKLWSFDPTDPGKHVVHGFMPAVDKKGVYTFLNPGKKDFTKSAEFVAQGDFRPAANGDLFWFGHGPEGFKLYAVKASKVDRFERLADWVRQNPEFAKEAPFPRHVVVEAGQRLDTMNRRLNASRQSTEFAGQFAKPSGSFAPDTPTISVADFYGRLGMDPDAAMRLYAQRIGKSVPPSKDEILQAVEAGKMTPDAADKALADLRNFNKEMKTYALPKRLADDYLKPIWNPTTKGTPLERPAKALDSFTALFKSFALSWPATKVRDLVSGQIENKLRGMLSNADLRDAAQLMQGATVKGAGEIPAVKEILRRNNQPLTGEAADRAGSDILRALYTGHSAGSYQAAAGDIALQTAPVYGKGGKEVLEQVPGATGRSAGQGAWSILGDIFGSSWNPLNVRGVGERTASTFGPSLGFERLGNITDQANRLAPFINQLRQGVDPGEAMRRIASAQVNYDPRTFTAAERLLKRVFPFYAFSTRKGIDIGKELMAHPGGRTAQAIRGIGAGHSQDALLPDYLQDTAALPLPAGIDDGTRRYLTGLGLMMEGPMQLLPSSSTRTTLLELLSGANPLIKGPLEWATGQSFFQKGPQGGRELADLDPTLGRLLANITGRDQVIQTPRLLEVILSNVPGSRVLTTLRQLTDTRKGIGTGALNALTGFKTTDVSPGAQDVVLRELAAPIEKSLGAREFTRIYFPKELKAQMTPAQRLEVAKLEALNVLLAERAKQRKKAKEGR
jgi:hypothetical protein